MTLVFLLLALAQPCHVQDGGAPDPVCTPGESEALVAADICGERSTLRRHVTEAMKRKVFRAYGLAPVQKPGVYEIDHRIPVCLGGASTMANLWPQLAPDFHAKDRVEETLCRLVCAGHLDLAEAQAEIRADWRAAFRQYVDAGVEP